MYLRALLLCGLAMQAACTAGETPLVAPPVACSVTKAADVPLSFVHGHVAAAVLIEGKPATMLVDTGSETTIVTPGAVQDFRLQPDPHRVTDVIGTGGVIASRNVLLQSFGIGGMEVLDQSDAVAPIPDFSLLQTDVAGALGADWLSDYDVEIDLAAQRIGVFTVQDCTGDYLPWTGPRHRVAALLFGRGLVLLPVTVDGVHLVAVLDSGGCTPHRRQRRFAPAGRGADAAGAGLAAAAPDLDRLWQPPHFHSRRIAPEHPGNTTGLAVDYLARTSGPTCRPIARR